MKGEFTIDGTAIDDGMYVGESLIWADLHIGMDQGDIATVVVQLGCSLRSIVSTMVSVVAAARLDDVGHPSDKLLSRRLLGEQELDFSRLARHVERGCGSV
jgi:hypothetical protein